MIEVYNINSIGKGSLLATCDVHIAPWHMNLHEVKIFQKGNQRWLGMPAREFANDMGEKKYIDLITFDSEAIKNRFRAQVMEAVDKYLEQNPEMKPDDAVKEGDEIPF
jgi:hypothetical protein